MQHRRLFTQPCRKTGNQLWRQADFGYENKDLPTCRNFVLHQCQVYLRLATPGYTIEQAYLEAAGISDGGNRVGLITVQLMPGLAGYRSADRWLFRALLDGNPSLIKQRFSYCSPARLAGVEFVKPDDHGVLYRGKQTGLFRRALAQCVDVDRGAIVANANFPDERIEWFAVAQWRG